MTNLSNLDQNLEKKFNSGTNGLNEKSLLNEAKAIN